MSGEFPTGVHACSTLRPALKSGLQALANAASRHITALDPGRLTGSVDIDGALVNLLPRDERWDYAVGHQSNGKAPDEVHWIEIHACRDGEVKRIAAKLDSLRRWMSSNASQLWGLPKRFVWVSSGRTVISPKSPMRRRVAALGVTIAGSHYVIR